MFKITPKWTYRYKVVSGFLLPIRMSVQCFPADVVHYFNIYAMNVWTVCSSTFSGKITKSSLFHVCCCGQLCSCRTLPSADMLPVECSVTNWERPANSAALYWLGSLYKQHFSLLIARGKEIGRLWHWSNVGASFKHKFCEIGLLK